MRARSYGRHFRIDQVYPSEHAPAIVSLEMLDGEQVQGNLQIRKVVDDSLRARIELFCHDDRAMVRVERFRQFAIEPALKGFLQ